MATIEKAQKEDAPILMKIWEASVRTTHDFLSEEDIAFYRAKIPEKYFPALDLYVAKIEGGEIAGFMGISDKKLEMLFVSPKHFRKNFGKELAGYAIKKLGITEVDVNEENPIATLFYVKNGFEIVSRSDTDSEGRNFPVLHMKLK